MEVMVAEFSMMVSQDPEEEEEEELSFLMFNLTM